MKNRRSFPNFWPNITIITILFIFIFSLIPLNPGCGETVLHRFSSKEPDGQLENVMYLTAGVALSQAGFSSTRKGKIFDYILLTEYIAKASEVKISYTLFTASIPEHILAVWEFDLSIDYNLDEQIAGAVEQLLKTAHIEAATTKQAEIGELLPEFSQVEAEDSTNPDSLGQDASTGANLQEELTTGQAQPIKFDSSVSAAVVILLGEVTEYFHYGAAGLLTAGVLWPLESFSINLDTKFSLIRVFNNEGVVGGPLYLSTAGLNLQIGTGADSSYRATIGISGGAALITVAGATEIMTKTVPYADIGVYTTFLLGEYFFLGGNFGFMMIFDHDLLIMGISPTLTLGFKV